MVCIYSPHKNRKRLEFVASHVFGNILGVDFQITDQVEAFLAHKGGPGINYSEESLGHGVQIVPQGLLFEEGISPKDDPEIFRWKGVICFFGSAKGDVPFDLFSATFYLLTLYEECFGGKVDSHGRFSHTDALLYRADALETAVVDRWTYLLRDALVEKGMDTKVFKLRKFRFISTFDIDHPYLYWNKGVVRTLGGMAKDLLRLRLSKVWKRLAVNLKIEEDPYYKALLEIERIHEAVDWPYRLFILMGGKTRYDRRTAVEPRRYYRYIKGLQRAKIGLHPSYNTYQDLSLLLEEKWELEVVLGRSVSTTRQHFLRLQNPETFQNLALAGFDEDFSLAFAHAPGFRAGTSVPYRFYDMEREEMTSLWIRPTVFMDSTLIYHQKSSAEDGLMRIKRLIDECKRVGGDYVGLWHNSNLSGKADENEWINVWIEGLKYGISAENN